MLMTTPFSQYVCYCPRSQATDAVLERKAEVFEQHKATTHWPFLSVVPEDLYDGPNETVNVIPTSVPHLL